MTMPHHDHPCQPSCLNLKPLKLLKPPRMLRGASHLQLSARVSQLTACSSKLSDGPWSSNFCCDDHELMSDNDLGLGCTALNSHVHASQQVHTLLLMMEC